MIFSGPDAPDDGQRAADHLEEAACRRGVDDLRSQFVTATFTSTIRVGLENCTVEEPSDLDGMTKRLGRHASPWSATMMVAGWDG